MDKKTFIINTYSEDKYRELSSRASDQQLHIVDNDELHRTVVPSYDLLVDKVKLGLGYDTESTEILLKDVDGNVISRLPAKHFISDNYLMSAAYDEGKLILSVLLSNDEVNAISVDFPVDQTLSPLSDYLSSSYPIASKAVASALTDLSDQISVELLALSNSLTAEVKRATDREVEIDDTLATEVERATTAEKELEESAALSVQNLSSELMPLINAAQATADLKTTDTLESAQGRSRIFNEYTGGGAKVEDKRGINSFVGVNLPNETSGAYGSLYVLSGNIGPRLKMFKEGFNYKKTDSNWYSFEENAELATVKDIDDAFSKVSGTWTAASCEIVDMIKQQDGQVSVIYKVLDVAGVSGLQDELNLKATKDEVALKVTDTLISDWGKSRIFNERTGGGAKIEDSVGGKASFVGVNHPNLSSGPYGSLYVIDPATKVGTRLKMFADGFNYKKASSNWSLYEQSADLVTFADMSACSSTLEEQINDISSNLVAYALSADVSVIRDEQTAADNFLSGKIDDEAERAEGVEDELSTAIKQKIWIKDPSSSEFTDGKYSDLSVVKLPAEEYYQKVVDETIVDNVLYILSANKHNAFGENVTNLAEPTLSDDAATKGYVDNKFAEVSSKYVSISVLSAALSSITVENGKSTIELTHVADALYNLKLMISTL